MTTSEGKPPHKKVVADAPPDQAPDTSAPSSDQRPRIREAVLLAVVGAAVTAVVTVIATGALGSVVGGDTDGSTSRDKPASGSSKVETAFVPASSSDGAVTVQKPVSWGFESFTSFGLPFAGKVDTGSGVTAGLNVGLTDSNAYDSERLFVTATATAPERLQMVGRSKDELRDYMRVLNRDIDFTKVGCALIDEGELNKPEFVSSTRTWEGCRGYSDMRFIEFYASSNDGRVLVGGQSYTSVLTRDEQMRLVTEWTVRREALPTGDATPAGDSVDAPQPPWEDNPVSP